jgi:16S rRNA (guanine966-N2)-methyltransferase
VREAIFNALHSQGAVVGARVLDLYAGSGALGIEALSRGARHATFVENARPAVAAIGLNLEATGLADRATVVTRDVTAYCRTAGDRFDLAFADPPYAFDAWSELLAVVPADVVMVESDREIDLGEGWEVIRVRRYGSTVVTLGRRPPGASVPRLPGPAEPEPR